MYRSLFALLVVSPLVAAPAPKAKDAVYFPTREGDKREYEVRAGGVTVEGGYTDTVTKVEKKDGALHVTITRERPDAKPFVTVIAVGAEGLSRVESDGQPLDKPALLLKLPAKAGTTWDHEGGGATHTVVGEEEVEVPAGKYKAVRVDLAAKGSESKTSLWFAPAVGLVKMSHSDSDRVQVLKAFTPGK